MTPPILSVRNVSVRFGGIAALDDISFDLRRRLITGLIGPNGAGKTTLFNCLSRLYDLTDGDILFEGRVCGFLFGLPALRLERLYLALATLALSVATPQILKLLLETWTGGVLGLVIVKPSAPFGLPLSDDQWLYFFALFVTVLMFWFATNLVNSQSGRAMMAIRDNPIAARSMGINSAVHKALTFGVSALYAGVAGALSAIVVQFVAPNSFTIQLSISLPVGLVVGGLG